MNTEIIYGFYHKFIATVFNIDNKCMLSSKTAYWNHVRNVTLKTGVMSSEFSFASQ